MDGKVTSILEDEAPSGPVPIHESSEEMKSGTTMMAFVRDGRWEVYVNMDCAELPEDAWDNVPEADIANAFDSAMLSGFGNRPTRYEVFGEKGTPPMNCAFRTSTSRKGVLQIVSFTEQNHPPPEMRIRYKLVQAVE